MNHGHIEKSGLNTISNGIGLNEGPLVTGDSAFHMELILMRHSAIEPHDGGECPMAVAVIDTDPYSQYRMEWEDGTSILGLADLLFFHPAPSPAQWVKRLHQWLVPICLARASPRQELGIVRLIMSESYDEAIEILSRSDPDPFLLWVVHISSHSVSDSGLAGAIKQANMRYDQSRSSLIYSVLSYDIERAFKELSILDRLLFCCWRWFKEPYISSEIWRQWITSALEGVDSDPLHQAVKIFFRFHLDDRMPVEELLQEMIDQIWRPAIQSDSSIVWSLLPQWISSGYSVVQWEKAAILWQQWIYGWLFHAHGVAKASNSLYYQKKITDPLLEEILSITSGPMGGYDELEIDPVLIWELVVALYSPFPDHRQAWTVDILVQRLRAEWGAKILGVDSESDPLLLGFLKEVLTIVKNESIGSEIKRNLVTCNLLHAQEKNLVQDLDIPIQIIGMARVRWLESGEFMTRYLETGKVSKMTWTMEHLAALSLIGLDSDQIPLLLLEGYVELVKMKRDGDMQWIFSWTGLLEWMAQVLPDHGRQAYWRHLGRLICARADFIDCLTSLSILDEEEDGMNQNFLLRQFSDACSRLSSLVYDPEYVKGVLEPIARGRSVHELEMKQVILDHIQDLKIILVETNNVSR